MTDSMNIQQQHFIFFSLQNQGRFYLRAYPSQMYLDTRIHLSSVLDIPDSYLLDQHLNNSLPDPHPPTPQQTAIGEAIVADLVHRMQKIKQMLKKGDLPRDNDERGNQTNEIISTDVVVTLINIG
jgi:hypothetical protein